MNLKGSRKIRWLAWMALAGLLRANAAEPVLGAAIAHPGDGALMVYVPAGEFSMGLDEAEADRVAKDLGFGTADELWAWETYPKRKVDVSGFFIDKYEVTVELWQKYVKATGNALKSAETSRHFDQPDEQLLPAAEIPWDAAKKYAAWSGKTLPTEAQWEKAARGTDGRLYPWGNTAPTPGHGHFGPRGVTGESAKGAKLYTLVGSYPKGASPCGALDMLGNQYEWTADRVLPYPDNPQAAKMKGYADGTMVCLRGGSWYHGWISYYAAKRFGFKADETYYHVGFRTVWTPPAGYFQSTDFRKAQAAAPEREAQIAALRRLAAKP